MAWTVSVLGTAELVAGWKLDGAFEALAPFRSFHAVCCCWLDRLKLSLAFGADDENSAAEAGTMAMVAPASSTAAANVIVV